MNKAGFIARFLYCHNPIRKPLVNNKIVFTSYKGKQYSCNPMYICEYLLDHFPGQFQIVWAFLYPEKFTFLKEKGIEVVEAESRKHVDHMLTAKFIITNYELYAYLPKIKGQFVMNTWHGGGLYKIVGFSNKRFSKNLRTKLYMTLLYSRFNIYLSSSKKIGEEEFIKGLKFHGELMNTGMPRNSILFNTGCDYIKEKVFRFFDLKENTRIILYAPTWRSTKGYNPADSLDFKKVCNAIKSRFGGEEWVVLYRQHYMSKDQMGVFQATEYPDMQELLYVSDVLITDYSSCSWDFSLMLKPVFLYCPDLDDYKTSRNFFLPIEQWPYILCKDGENSLIRAIESFDEQKYVDAVKKHHEYLESYENEFSNKMVCDRICQECGIEK